MFLYKSLSGELYDKLYAEAVYEEDMPGIEGNLKLVQRGYRAASEWLRSGFGEDTELD